MSKFVLTAQLQLQAPNNVGQVVSQIQKQLNSVTVKIQAQGASKANKQIKQLSKTTKEASDNAAAMGRSFAVSFKRFAAFSIATRAVGLLTRSLADAVGEALDFERQLIKVAQVTGKTVGELDGLVKEIRNLATGLGVSSKALLGVSRVLSQAGLSAGETKVALEALAKSSLSATFDDIANTAEGAIAIFNQFGKGAEALEAQLGAINAVAGQFAVEAGDIIAAIRRTGGVFKAAGGDLNELIALFTSVRATTRESAESIATGLRTILTRIQRPTTIKYLEDLGISLTDVEGKFVGPFEAIKRLSAAMGNMEAGDLQFVKIAEQLGGFRQVGKIIPLLTQFSTAQEALNVAMGGANSMAADADKAQGALLVRITALKEEFLELIGSVTSSPVFKFMATGALALASAVIKVADAVKDFLPIIAALGAMKLFSGMSSFASGFGGMMKGVGGARAFASGGLVPGSGNRDTVPAMLTPGEFVIRKSSVGKIGANNLAGMNVKGYATAGPVTAPPPRSLTEVANESSNVATAGGIPFSNESFVSLVSSDPLNPMSMGLPSTPLDQILNESPSKAWKNPLAGVGAVSIADALGNDPAKLKAAEKHIAMMIQSQPSTYTVEGLDQKHSMAFDNALDEGMFAAMNTAATAFATSAGAKSSWTYKGNKEELSSIINAGVAGGIFEEVLNSLTGLSSEGMVDTTAPFDYTSGLGMAGGLYPEAAKAKYIDAKLTGRKSGAAAGTIDPVTGMYPGSAQGKSASRHKPGEIAEKARGQMIQEVYQSAYMAGISAGAPVTPHFGGPIQNFSNGGGARGSRVPHKKSPASQPTLSANEIELMLAQMNNRPMPPGVKAAAVGDSGRKLSSSEIAELRGEQLEQLGLKKAFGGLIQKFAIGGVVPVLGNNSQWDEWDAEQEELRNMTPAELRDHRNAKKREEAAAYKRGEYGSRQLKNRPPMGHGEPDNYRGSGKADHPSWHGESVHDEMRTVKNLDPDKQRGKTGFSLGTQEFQYREIEEISKDGTTSFKSFVDPKGAGHWASSKNIPWDGPPHNDTEYSKKLAVDGQDVEGQRKRKAIQDKEMHDYYNKKGEDGLSAFDKTQIGQMAFDESGNREPDLPKGDGTGFGFKAGGGVTDTIPALLTPGEFVINKKSAQNIGASNLDRMNKQGVTGFAAGGPVGMAAGGMMGGGGMGGMMALAALPQLISSFGDLGETGQAVTGALTKLIVVGTMYTKAQEINAKAVKGFGDAMVMATSASHEEVAAKIEAAAEDGERIKKTKDAKDALGKLGLESRNLSKKQRIMFKVQGDLAKKSAEAAKALKAGGASAKELNKAQRQAMSDAKAMQRSSQENLGGNDLKIFQQGLREVSKSAKGFDDTMVKTRDYMQQFAEATRNGASAEEAALSATQDTISGEKKKTTILTRASNAARRFSNRMREAGQKVDKFAKGTMATVAVIGQVADVMKKLANNAMEKALNEGSLGGRGEVDAEGNRLGNSFEQARDQVSTSVNAGQVSAIAGGATTGGAAGMAMGGPMGAIIGMAIGGVIGNMTYDAEEETKKAQDKIAKAELSALSVRLAADLEQIKELGAIRVDTLVNIKKDFVRGRDAIRKIAKEEDREKAGKELDASMIGAAAATGGLARDAEHLAMIIGELSAGEAPELRAKLKSAATAAFNLKEAMKVVIKANYDAAKVMGVFNRASLGVDNFVKSLETGSSRLGPAIAILEESLKNFTLGDISGANLNDLRTEAFGAMQRAGIGFGSEAGKALDSQFDMLQKATEAQAKMPVAMNNMNFTAGMTDVKIKDTMLEGMVNNLGINVDSDVGKTIAGQIAKLTDEDIRAIKTKSFDFSKFLEGTSKEIAGLGKAALHALKALEKHEAMIATLTKKRIALEQALMAAQKSAIDMQLEAAKLMAEFGGATVTTEMQKRAVLDKSNISSQRLGLGQMTTGSAAEVTAMSQAMQAQFASLELRSQVPGAFAGAQGLDADSRKDLLAAQQELANTTRELIKINREALGILEKKNQLEKDSLEALIKGDMEKFLKDSMGVGATALIATGNEAMAGALFGIEGVASAFENIQTMQEAGVQSIFGQQLGGVGGVAERGAGAALGLRGIEDPRMAALLAGTTAEAEALKVQNRALAGSLAGIGGNISEMTAMQVATAQITIDQANVVFNRELRQGEAQLLSRGGTVYAADGVEMFKPKGTDTVPAMLTPGEVVVNKAGVAAGNNRKLLRKMNKGEGVGGGQTMVAAIDPSIVNTLVTGLNNFNKGLSSNIDKLNKTKFQVKLETTNVNVNLNGGGFLTNLKEEIKTELMDDIGERIKDLRFSQSGGATFSSNVLDS
jgi:hypothetical protein